MTELVQQLRHRTVLSQTDALQSLDLLARAQRIEDEARRAQLALELETSRKTEELAAELLQSVEALHQQEKAERAKAAREAKETRLLHKIEAEAAQRAAAAAHMKKLGQRRYMAELRKKKRQRVEVGAA